jgi:hypothetical protein
MKKGIVVLCALGLSIVPFTTTQAFWSDVFFSTHQDITEAALSLDVQTFTPPFCFTVTSVTTCYAFDPKAIRQINLRHWAQDTSPYDPNDHFDNNTFAASLTKMATTRGQLNSLLSGGLTPGGISSTSQQQIWRLLGNILHAAEDFYAHSTWVDEGNTTTIANFGSLTEETSSPNVAFFTSVALPTYCGTLGYPLQTMPVNYLISGFYNVMQPSGGCIHGATLPTLYSLFINQPSPSLVGLCDYSDTTPQTVPGISHDVGCPGNYNPSNTLALHNTAYKLAVQEAQSLVRAIVADLSSAGNGAGFCVLLGLPATAAPCSSTAFKMTVGQAVDVLNVYSTPPVSPAAVWTSSNASVAAFNASEVYGESPGTAVLTASDPTTGGTAVATVTVLASANNPSVTATSDFSCNAGFGPQDDPPPQVDNVFGADGTLGYYSGGGGVWLGFGAPNGYMRIIMSQSVAGPGTYSFSLTDFESGNYPWLLEIETYSAPLQLYNSYAGTLTLTAFSNQPGSRMTGEFTANLGAGFTAIQGNCTGTLSGTFDLVRADF